MNLLIRADQQFHWVNQGYESFDDFLGALTSAKRKNLRKERRQKRKAGLEFVHITGDAITEEHWDSFFRFYIDTGARKWGSPYLTRETFTMLGQRMAENILLIFAMEDGIPVAGAMNMIGSDTLYGRYWGCLEARPMLHFETCYYQAIDYAIEHGLKYVEAGGAKQWSGGTSWIAHAGLRAAMARGSRGNALRCPALDRYMRGLRTRGDWRFIWAIDAVDTQRRGSRYGLPQAPHTV